MFRIPVTGFCPIRTVRSSSSLMLKVMSQSFMTTGFIMRHSYIVQGLELNVKVGVWIRTTSLKLVLNILDEMAIGIVTYRREHHSGCIQVLIKTINISIMVYLVFVILNVLSLLSATFFGVSTSTHFEHLNKTKDSDNKKEFKQLQL